MSSLNHLPPGSKCARGRSFKKGHSGQWPRPADADTKLILCPKCKEYKLLRDFLRGNNQKNAQCNICMRPIISLRSKSYRQKLKDDPEAAKAALDNLDRLQAEEAVTIGSGYKNIEKWRYHIAKWARQRSILRTICGLQPKRGVRSHFEYQARHGIIPADSVNYRVREYYKNHPDEQPSDEDKVGMENVTPG